GLDYPPGDYAETDELVELSREAARLGGIYHTHVRYRKGDMYLDPFMEALEIGRRSGIPAHITHFYQSSITSRGSADGLLHMVEDARDKEGLDVTFDSYPVILRQHPADHRPAGLGPGRRPRSGAPGPPLAGSAGAPPHG